MSIIEAFCQKIEKENDSLKREYCGLNYNATEKKIAAFKEHADYIYKCHRGFYLIYEQKVYRKGVQSHFSPICQLLILVQLKYDLWDLFLDITESYSEKLDDDSRQIFLSLMEDEHAFIEAELTSRQSLVTHNILVETPNHQLYKNTGVLKACGLFGDMSKPLLNCTTLGLDIETIINKR